MSAAPTEVMRFFRIGDVLATTGIRSKSDLYRRIARDEFPKGERISHKLVVWPEAVIARWQWSHLPDDLKELIG